MRKKNNWVPASTYELSPELLDLLGGCFLFKNVPEPDWALIAARGHLRHHDEGYVFFNQGEDATYFFIIVSGRAKLSKVDADGHQTIVNYFGPGDELGLIVALGDIPFPLTAEAIEDCTAISWSRETIIELVHDYPQLALNAIEMIGRRFVRLQERNLELATQRVERRVAGALIRLIRQFGRRTDEGILLDMALSREDLAQMTGTNLYNVSRIFSRWEQAGYIITSRRQIILSNAHGLVAIAEDLPEPNTKKNHNPPK